MKSLKMIASSPRSSPSVSFRLLCLLLVAIATFSPAAPTAHAFVVQPAATWTTAPLSRGGTSILAHHHFNTRLASATVKDSSVTASKTMASIQANKQQVLETMTLQKRQTIINTDGMSHFIQALEESTNLATVEPAKSESTVATTAASPSLDTVLKVAGGVFVAIVAMAIYSTGWTMQDVTTNAQMLVTNPQETMSTFIAGIQELGPAAPLYFGVLYFLAELLAIPATPLTLSAGYLLGLQTGSLVVLCAAVAAASVSFVIGKTVLRGAVQEQILSKNPKWAKLDQALGSSSDGFKLLLLVRLTPLFPFSIANYIYGASAIDFKSYFFATLLGFTPGTVAYVYTGMVGQALTSGADGTQPWYVYMGGLAVLAGLLKLATDVATNVIETMGVNDDDDEHNSM
jgi:uncharacterized membrane protein YdjX (TVP38/TMEM64 family)